MKNKILSYLLGGLLATLLGFGGLGLNYVNATGDCNGIKLNTNFPGIGTCISFSKNGTGTTNPTNVFQKTIGTFTKLIMSIILVVCFVMIIIAGIMRAGAGEDSSQKTKAKKLIERVAITILLIGFSGVILRIINPNFFG